MISVVLALAAASLVALLFILPLALVGVRYGYPRNYMLVHWVGCYGGILIAVYQRKKKVREND